MADCLVYFAIFGLVFTLNFIAIRQKSKLSRNCLIVASFIILLAFIGFRYNVGTDYGNYLEQYNIVQSTEWEKLPSLRLELLVATIFKLCSYVFLDAKMMFVVFGFFLLFPIYRVNKLYDYKYLAYSVLVYCVLFLPFGLNGMRQGVAMGFILLAFVRFMKGNVKMGVFNIIVSSLFHTSALIALPYMIAIYICRRWKLSFTKMNIVITIFLALAVLFFLNDILIEHGITQYNYMLGSTDVENIYLKSIIVYLPITLFSSIHCMQKEQKFEVSAMRNLTISGICLFAVGTSAQYLSRFGLYFMMPSILLLPELIQNISKKRMRTIAKGALVAYLIGFFIMQYAVFGKHDILPYHTWIFGSEQMSLVAEWGEKYHIKPGETV